MSEGLASFLLGTIGLDVALLAAIAIAIIRPPAASVSLRVTAACALLMQALHFAEESLTGFGQRFPARLGLAPWPDGLFVGFNLVWIAIWLAAIAGIGWAPRPAGAALWFLAIAAVANGVAHPALALAAGGYFPGLATAPFLGCAGLYLGWRLMRAPRSA